jgi:hypothetical protein
VFVNTANRFFPIQDGIIILGIIAPRVSLDFSILLLQMRRIVVAGLTQSGFQRSLCNRTSLHLARPVCTYRKPKTAVDRLRIGR